MALSFMSATNQRGSTTYVIYGSHPDDFVSAAAFQTQINADQPDEVILLDKNSNDARELMSFYAINDTRTPQTFLISESDQLLYHWSSSLPAADDLLYRLHQLGD
jgi:hypothetical protein